MTIEVKLLIRGYPGQGLPREPRDDPRGIEGADGKETLRDPLASWGEADPVRVEPRARTVSADGRRQDGSRLRGPGLVGSCRLGRHQQAQPHEKKDGQ